MYKIAVSTSTRAEYGVIKNLIKLIDEDETLELQLLVSGTHLLKKYGNTINEIKNDGFNIKKTINFNLESNTAGSITKSMGIAMISFADAFEELQPDMLIVIGDRYELISICTAAFNAHIPIAHISGGEITEGALDDVYRHCVTKLSSLHFPACQEYRHRIIQLGEDPAVVFDYGDIGVENIKKICFLEKNNLEDILKLDLNRQTMLFTYHPVTVEQNDPIDEIIIITTAITTFKDWNIVITASNSDNHGEEINRYLKKFAGENDNCFYFESLGIQKYLSLMKYSTCVIGNSSSGIIEAPVLGIPSINIGKRQRGRLQANTIVNAKTEKDDIIEKIKTVSNPTFLNSIGEVKTPYKLDKTSEKIIMEIKNYLNEHLPIKSSFYDINF